MVPEENHLEDSILSIPRSLHPLDQPELRQDLTAQIEAAKLAMGAERYDEAHASLKDALVSRILDKNVN